MLFLANLSRVKFRFGICTNCCYFGFSDLNQLTSLESLILDNNVELNLLPATLLKMENLKMIGLNWYIFFNSTCTCNLKRNLTITAAVSSNLKWKWKENYLSGLLPRVLGWNILTVDYNSSFSISNSPVKLEHFASCQDVLPFME